MKAFPQSQFRGDEPVDTSGHGGMTLRDFFAAKAMQAVLSNESLRQYIMQDVKRTLKQTDSVTYENISKEFSKEYYRIADAMMEARND